MLELRKHSSDTYRRDFAGDTYNSAVYAKRWNTSLNISYFTALGQDPISEEMLQKWADLGLDCQYVLRSTERLPGIYAINVDEHGERSFTYWRENSAARTVMRLLAEQGDDFFSSTIDYVYVSGISFAILDEADKQSLLDLLKALQSRGAQIAYDPNYRAKMWSSREHACQWNNAVYALADIIFPGIEDHQDMYGHNNKSEIVDFLSSFSDDRKREKEIVLKCGDGGVYGYQEQGQQLIQIAHQPFVPAAVQVDSTAAGDSFAGTYLAARAEGRDIESAIAAAMGVAGFVVQHQGAIAPEGDYDQCRSKLVDEL